MLTKRKLLDMIIDMKAIMNFQEADIKILERKVTRLENKAAKKTEKPSASFCCRRAKTGWRIIGYYATILHCRFA